MTNVQELWKAINSRVGKVEQALLLGAVATVIAVPIAVAGPQGSPNLATTPTTTGSATTSARTIEVSSTFTLTLTPGSSVSIVATVGGHTVQISGDITGNGPTTVIVSKNGLTINAPGGVKLGQLLKLEGLPPGQVTITAVILETPTFGPMERAGALGPETVSAAGRTVTFTTTVGPDGSIAIPASLQGVPLASLSIVQGATVSANPGAPAAGAAGSTTGNSSPAQTPAQTPAQVPGKLPTGLPSTGAGGMAS